MYISMQNDLFVLSPHTQTLIFQCVSFLDTTCFTRRLQEENLGRLAVIQTYADLLEKRIIKEENSNNYKD